MLLLEERRRAGGQLALSIAAAGGETSSGQAISFEYCCRCWKRDVGRAVVVVVVVVAFLQALVVGLLLSLAAKLDIKNYMKAYSAYHGILMSENFSCQSYLFQCQWDYYFVSALVSNKLFY